MQPNPKIARGVLSIATAATFATAAAVLALLPAQSANAQNDALASEAHGVIGAAQPVHREARIIGIDASTRTITLQGAKGAISTAIVSDQVGNFDQLNVGDRVDVLYKNALLLSAEKAKGADKGIRKRVDTQVVQPAASGAGFTSARQVEVLATVQGLNRKNRTITLRGPWRTDTFDIAPDIDVSKLKVGDTIHAVFVSAAAVQVTPKDAAP